MHVMLREELESIAAEYEAKIQQLRQRRELLGQEVEEIQEKRNEMLDQIHSMKVAHNQINQILYD